MTISQAILPVAGLGTRFLPWTKVVPKELLPIGNRPIIALLVDECLSIGVTDICFVINRGKEAIPQYFYEHPELERELKKRGKDDLLEELNRYDNINIHVVYQDEQKGDGHAILQAADWVKSEHVAILFGDDLIVHNTPGLAQLSRALQEVPENLRREAAMLCLQNVPSEKIHRYGVVKLDGEDEARLKKIAGLVEKPNAEDAPSNYGIVGKYIIPKSTFNALPNATASHGGEIRLIDALILQLQHGMPVYGYEFEGQRLDTGNPEGYKEAVSQLG